MGAVRDEELLGFSWLSVLRGKGFLLGVRKGVTAPVLTGGDGSRGGSPGCCEEAVSSLFPVVCNVSACTEGHCVLEPRRSVFNTAVLGFTDIY